MSIPLKPHQSLQSLAAQGFAGFEEPVGTKNQENKKCPPIWKKLGEKGERGQENGTLGNVQGNHLSEQMEKLNRNIAGGGILGNCLINQTPFLSPLPFTFSKEVKAKHESGQNPATLGFLDMIYCPWTVFIFPGRDLFLDDKLD